jgi:microcystin-dependent protein
MPCQDCFDNCNPLVTDRCVKYTGDDIPALGIVYGDNLLQVEQDIINKLLSFIDGSGIDVSDATITCQYLINYLQGKDQTLINVLQMLIDGSCGLAAIVNDITTELNTPVAFDTSCLDDVPSEATPNQVLQAAVNKICELDTTVTNIDTDYVKNSQLCSLVTACIAGSASTQEYTKMPKYVALPYFGSLSVFDSSGKGIASQGYDKVYLCIGQTVNGVTLPDGRGRSPMGSNTNIPTSGIDNAVNPALTENAGYAITNKQKLGNYTQTLTTPQIPSHSHSVTDPGHHHTLNMFDPGNSVGGTGDGVHWKIGGSTNTSTAPTGISIASAGGNQPHNTLHPVFGCNYIAYIP